MFTPITMHPPLFGRFDRDSGFGGGARGGFSQGPARRPAPKGETDSSGNYRNDNVWRSGNSSAPRGGERREGGFGGGAPREGGGGFRKPWEKREGGFGGGAPREGGGGFHKPWEKREGGFGGGGAPREGGFGGDRGGGFRKPWEKREGGFGGGAPREGGFGGGDRGGDRGGFRKPWEKREGGFGGGAPREGGFGGDRGGGFQKPWEKREGGFGGGAPREGGFGGDRGGDRGGFHKPWEKREGGFGGGAPREGGFGGDRGGGFHKPWEKREGGFGGGAPREGGDRGGGFHKPWEKREGGFGGGAPREGGDRGDRGGGFSKPWENRDRPENTDRAPAPVKAPHVPKVPEGELLFGRQPVREMLRANRRIVKEMMISDGVKDSEEVLEIKQTCEAREIKIEFHKKETLDSWLNSANHQGIVAACEEYPYAELEEVLAALEAKQGNALIVVLDHVVDPQNLGSLLRTCETAGAVGVVLPSDRAVGVTPAAVRASAGAAEHLLIARIPNLVSVLERMKDLGVWSTGLEAMPESKPYTTVDYKGKVCIVVGSEGHGLSSPVRGKCDNLVSLPMFGKVSSLNAGVAGAIAIYEVLRQQNA